MDEKCQFLSLHVSYLPIQVLKTSLLRLPCKASGSPKPVIEWRINGFPVKEFGASVNPNTGDLVISSAKGEIHSGFYQCFATNKAGQIVSKSFAQVGDSILSNSDDYDAFDEVESVRDFQVSPIYTFLLRTKVRSDFNIHGTKYF